jgi:hypothetical protein
MPRIAIRNKQPDKKRAAKSIDLAALFLLGCEPLFFADIRVGHEGGRGTASGLAVAEEDRLMMKGHDAHSGALI